MEWDPSGAEERRVEPFERLLAELEDTVLTACASRTSWPEQVGAGICTAVDFAIDHPAVVDALAVADGPSAASESAYPEVVGRLAKLISRDAPEGSRLPISTDEALVAGIIGLVGDHLRVARFDALRELRPDLVLLALLPYLGFDQARHWANEFAIAESGD